jgi:quercetin dioxygenase-like cupin family protein
MKRSRSSEPRPQGPFGWPPRRSATVPGNVVLALSLTLTVVMTTAPSAQSVAPGTYASGKELATELRQLASQTDAAAMVVARVDNTTRTRVNLIHRTEPRNAIVHDTGWEVHHITAGSATIVTGGRVERSTHGNGDTIATIVGGESRHVVPGDVVIVPAGTPHWYSAIDEPVTYLEIRYDPGASGEIAPLVTNWETADWGPPTNRPGFPEGLRNADIATDPATGGPTYLSRFPAGAEFAPHWHTYTETVTVLEGEVDIVLDGTRHTATAGSYVIIPAKAHHSWHVPAGRDVVLLARRDGPADFFFVEN